MSVQSKFGRHYSEESPNDKWFYLSDSSRHIKGAPKKSGIYCFIQFDLSTGKKRPIYVGKSEDLSIRLKMNHKAERAFRHQKLTQNNLLLLKIMITENFHEKEISYIKKLKPFFNVCHNPNIQRKIIYENGQTLY